jgi:hypothetical protein
LEAEIVRYRDTVGFINDKHRETGQDGVSMSEVMCGVIARQHHDKFLAVGGRCRLTPKPKTYSAHRAVENHLSKIWQYTYYF